MISQLINVLEIHKTSKILMNYNVTNEVKGAVYYAEDDILCITDDVEYEVSEHLYDTRGHFKSEIIIYRFKEREENNANNLC